MFIGSAAPGFAAPTYNSLKSEASPEGGRSDKFFFILNIVTVKIV